MAKRTGRQSAARFTEIVSGGQIGTLLSFGSGRQGCWAAGSSRVCLGGPTTKRFRREPTMKTYLALMLAKKEDIASYGKEVADVTRPQIRGSSPDAASASHRVQPRAD